MNKYLLIFEVEDEYTHETKRREIYITLPSTPRKEEIINVDEIHFTSVLVVRSVQYHSKYQHVSLHCDLIRKTHN